MAIDTQTVNSPGWWMQRLYDDMQLRITRLNKLRSYMDGNAPLPEGAEGLREAYWSFQKKARTNFGALVVEAPQERMSVCGFRIGDATELSKTANRIWSANELDTFAGDVHTDMLGLSDGYAIVGPPDSRGIPAITHEDPASIITIHDPVRRNVVSALKLFRDMVAEKDFAYLYLPGVVYVAIKDAVKDAIKDTPITIDGMNWVDGKAPMRWPRGFEDVVPVVRFNNRGGKGEFEDYTDIIDRINYTVLQRLVIIALQAFRQRAVKGTMPEAETGVDKDGDPAQIPIDYNVIFRPGPGALWMLPDGVELWESEVTDIQQILMAAKDDIRDLAAVTRTPMPTLLPDSQNQSAEGALFAREGLIFKTKERIKRATYGWNRVMSLALRFSGETADVVDIETLWLPPEMLSLSERADAASKLIAAQVPWKTIMTKVLQYSPLEVEDMEQERLADALSMNLAVGPNAGTGG